MRYIIFNPYGSPDRNPRVRRIEFLVNVLEENKLPYLVINRHGSFTTLPNKTSSSVVPITIRKNNWFTNLIKKIVFPDYWVFWTIRKVIYYNFFLRQSDDILITVSNPFSAHLLGLFVKSKRWIIDIGDLYTSNPHNQILQGFWKNLAIGYEKTILCKADTIILNSKNILDYYEKQYSLPKEKFHLIYNANFLSFDFPPKTNSSHTVLAYFGSTFNSLRTAKEELIILQELIKRNKTYTIYFIGNFHAEFIDFIESNEFLAKQSQFGIAETDLQLQSYYREVDILLNFSNGTYLGLQSKLVEYVQSGIAILNFYTTTEEASLDFLLDIEATMNCNVNHYSIESIELFIDENKSKSTMRVDHRNTQIAKQWQELLKPEK